MNIIAIVQARMGSERFPGKVVKEIIGKPMIIHVLDRLKKSRYIDDIILATSDLKKENTLVDIVLGYGYRVFRGEEKNVLKRYYDANKKYKGDIVVRITGDCPLIDAQIVDNVISYYLMYDFDYVRLDVPETFVRGFDVEVFSSKILENVYREVENTKVDEYKEHVTLYIYRNPDKFKIGTVKGEKFYRKDYRLCVDTEEDFEIVKKIYEHFKNEYISSKECISFLDFNIDISTINSKVSQKT